MNKILAEEMKAYKKKMNFIPSFMPKPLNVKKQPEKNLNSTIHENENENLSNSSYENAHNFKDSKNKKPEKKENEKIEDEKIEEEKTENEKIEDEKIEDEKTEDKKIEVKINESDDNISKLLKGLSSSKSMNKKRSSLSKAFNTSDNENKIENNDIIYRKKTGNLPIYNMSNSKVASISRKMSCNKKKNIINNKYDFLI